MTLANYPNSLINLNKQINRSPNTFITMLAQNLVQSAQLFDLKRAQNLGVDARCEYVTRRTDKPVSYTSNSVLGAPWADDQTSPLEVGEKWNEGRRATNTNIRYTFNEHGLPINPYMDTGMNGRGVLGRFGPNHAVDNGVLTLKEDNNGDIKLHALGILRKFDGDVPALAGGFAEYSKNDDGGYTFNRNHELDTKTKEFFEEMVSGSIELMPEYKAVLTDEVNAALDTRIAARNGEDLSKRQKEEIAEQVETGLKLQQVETYDSGFLTRLYEITASGRECFAGPVLKSNRNTNNAWIETRLSWFMMDDTIWSYIKGKNPTFDYDFSPGDDASGVQLFEISPWLLDNASGSHGALFAFMSASYLLKMQEEGTEIPATVIDQMKDLASFLVSHKPQHYTSQTNARIYQ